MTCKIKTTTKHPTDDGRHNLTDEQQAIVDQAQDILFNQMKRCDFSISCSEDAKRYLVLKLGNRRKEVFAALYLNVRGRIIEYRELAFGTIDKATVYPREVVEDTLRFNAATVIFVHNHPSGCAEPSHSDQDIVQRLVAALELIDVKVLDNIIIAGQDVMSFADRGLL